MAKTIVIFLSRLVYKHMQAIQRLENIALTDNNVLKFVFLRFKAKQPIQNLQEAAWLIHTHTLIANTLTQLIYHLQF
jgi:hypothetical protein